MKKVLITILSLMIMSSGYTKGNKAKCGKKYTEISCKNIKKAKRTHFCWKNGKISKKKKHNICMKEKKVKKVKKVSKS